MSERDYEMQVSCRFCKKTYTLKVRVEDYLTFDLPNRPHIQTIFPYLTPGERELLMSGICDECWHKMFPPEPDDDCEEEDSDNE